ncbi:MAG: hypothetical protein IKD91_00790 [Clostridiales bacterium]|nr:hypothetical protein [Clostridiales bacterium]
MAKASGINKKLLAKKDMNFFAEFTANAAKQARLLGYGVVIGVLVVFVVLAFIVAFFIRNSIIKSQINELKELLSGPDYATLEQDSEALKAQLNDRTNYYYALTQMRRDVDEIDPAPVELPDIIEKCIPSDSFISNYSITNSMVTMDGYSFTYYSPVDMVNMLNAKNVFTARPTITIDRYEPDTQQLTIDEIIAGASVNAINNYYKFSISGTLIANVHIAITRYTDGESDTSSLGGIETITVKAGDQYEIDGVAQYEYAGTSYNLTSIYVNGVQVEEASFNMIVANNKYVDIGRGNYDIRFYYTPVGAEAPAEEG